MREYLNPSVTACHLPYILLHKTQRRSLKPPRLRHSPYIPLRGTQRESLNVPPCHLQKNQKKKSLNVSHLDFIKKRKRYKKTGYSDRIARFGYAV